MSTYLLHGKLRSTTGNAQNLAGILIEASGLVSTARGCRLYMVSREETDEDNVWVTEIWDSKEDHDASLAVEGVRELISKAIPLLDGNPQKGQELEILGGYGI